MPWWRICNVCGSHWDLHPMGVIGLVEHPEQKPDPRGIVVSALEEMGHEATMEDDNSIHICPIHDMDMDDILQIINARMWQAELTNDRLVAKPRAPEPACVIPSIWCNGWIKIDPTNDIDTNEPTGHIWSELLALVTKKTKAKATRDQQIGRVPTIPYCWACRGKIY